MSELSHTHENHMKLLDEVKSHLEVLMDFNLNHRGHWTAAELEEYKLHRLAWYKSVSNLTDFENNIPSAEDIKQIV